MSRGSRIESGESQKEGSGSGPHGGEW
jgi:hypothetical protein